MARYYIKEDIMEVYRHPDIENYSAIIYKHKETGFLGLTYNRGTIKYIKGWWSKNEKDYKIVEIKPIINTKALEYFMYWRKIPTQYLTSDQRCKVFDFFKYVCGANLSDKYRDKAYISEVRRGLTSKIKCGIIGA